MHCDANLFETLLHLSGMLKFLEMKSLIFLAMATLRHTRK